MRAPTLRAVTKGLIKRNILDYKIDRQKLLNHVQLRVSSVTFLRATIDG